MYTHVCVEEEDMEGSDGTQRGKKPTAVQMEVFSHFIYFFNVE